MEEYIIKCKTKPKSESYILVQSNTNDMKYIQFANCLYKEDINGIRYYVNNPYFGYCFKNELKICYDLSEYDVIYLKTDSFDKIILNYESNENLEFEIITNGIIIENNTNNEINMDGTLVLYNNGSTNTNIRYDEFILGEDNVNNHKFRIEHTIGRYTRIYLKLNENSYRNVSLECIFSFDKQIFGSFTRINPEEIIYNLPNSINNDIEEIQLKATYEDKSILLPHKFKLYKNIDVYRSLNNYTYLNKLYKCYSFANVDSDNLTSELGLYLKFIDNSKCNIKIFPYNYWDVTVQSNFESIKDNYVYSNNEIIIYDSLNNNEPFIKLSNINFSKDCSDLYCDVYFLKDYMTSEEIENIINVYIPNNHEGPKENIRLNYENTKQGCIIQNVNLHTSK